MKKIAVILHTTFTRFEMAKKTIDSFRYDSRFKLYISDTGAITHKKLRYYETLELGMRGHKVFFTGWDTSPAITRNFLVDMVEEDYVFKIDDDFLFNDKDVKVDEIIKLLDQNDELGLVGMSVVSSKVKSKFVFHAKRHISATGDFMRLNPIDIDNLKENIICDVTPDCWIAKREIFPQCNWDERYHVSEGLHTDFFLHIKFNTAWKVMYKPDSVIYTFKYDGEFDILGKKKGFYHKKRFRHLKNLKKFSNKWGLRKEAPINRW